MSRGDKSPLERHRSEAIRAARDLRYGENVIRSISEAKTWEEINRVLRAARNGKIGCWRDVDEDIQ